MELPVYLNNKDVNANTAQFGMFVVYMFQYGMNKKDKGNQYVTIKGKVSAIRWYHRYYTGVVPELDEGYQLMFTRSALITCALLPSTRATMGTEPDFGAASSTS